MRLFWFTRTSIGHWANKADIQNGPQPALPSQVLGPCRLSPGAVSGRWVLLAPAGALTLLFAFRRFSVQRCARCHLGISASEMVMRARDSVYHLSCFTCSTCNKTLTTGDHFGMKDSLVYCRAHFETLLQGEYAPQLSYTELAAKSGGLALPYFNGTGTVQKGRPRKRKSPALGVDIVNYNSGGSPNLTHPDSSDLTLLEDLAEPVLLRPLGQDKCLA